MPEGEEAEAKPKLKSSKTDTLELPEYSPDELRDVDKDILNGEITQLEEDIAKAKPNLNVLHEYRRREAEFLDRAREMESVTSQRDSAKQRYDDLRKVRLDEFMAGFNAISAKLKEMYQMITMGGNAEIELVDTMDPFSEGVVLSIMPPKKSWRPIANLSGGEKTLASLALVFALHVFKASREAEFANSSPHHSTSWTRLTPRSTLRTFPLSPTISSPRRRLLNCELIHIHPSDFPVLSFRSVMTCSSLLTAWSASTRPPT